MKTIKKTIFILTVLTLGIWVAQDYLYREDALMWLLGTFGVWAAVVFCITLISLIFPPIKWFTPKRFKGKKTPIYKLVNYGDDYNAIQKWELGWDRDCELWYAAFIPGYSLFKFIGYEHVGEIEINIPAEEIENLGGLYESLAAEKRLKEEQFLDERRKKDEPINKLNQEFKENYVK